MKYVYKNKKYIRLFSAVDLIGNCLFTPFRKRPEEKEYRKILLVRLDHIGDIIASTVVLDPLRRHFPDAQIDMLVPSWGEDIVKNNPAIDNVIVFNPAWFERGGSKDSGDVKGFSEMKDLMKKSGYDLGIDLRGDFRDILAMYLAGIKRRISYGITGGGFLLTDEVSYDWKAHETERNMKLLAPLGIEGYAPKADLHLSVKNEDRIRSLLDENNVESKYAIIHPFPGDPAKGWTEDEFIKVIAHFTSRGIRPVIIGAGSDRSAAKGYGERAVNLCGKTTIGEVSTLIKKAVMFIGVDSGPAHIAAYSDIPTVILFSGINDPGQWAPRADNVRVFCPGADKGLTEVKAEQVIEAMDTMLREEKII